jgi:hypothetical protein
MFGWKKKVQPKCILLAFEAEPHVYILDSYPKDGFSIGDDTYRQLYDLSGWSGFYDWLRDGDGTIIGVRQSLEDEVDAICRHLTLPYVVCDDQIIEVFFSTSRDYDPQVRCDQMFGDNGVFVARARQYAITFSTLLLTDTELALIQRLSRDASVVILP